MTSAADLISLRALGERRGRVLAAALFFGILALWTLLGLYFLLYPLGVVLKLVDLPPRIDPKPCGDPDVVKLEGPTLLIGDLHLTYRGDPSRLSSLARFTSSRGVENIVFVGDLFDSPRDASMILGSSSGEEAVGRILRAAGLNRSQFKVYFVKGSPSHDPEGFDLNYEGDGLVFRTLGKCARFSIDGVRVLSLHGDDAFGGLHGLIFSYLTGGPYLEGWWKNVMGLDEEEWVVMAHSHIPGIDHSKRAANTGGWTGLLGFGPPTGRGILIAGGEVVLVQVDE